MGSMFVEVQNPSKKKRKAWEPPPKPLLSFMQFVPAIVQDVVTGPGSSMYRTMRDINSIIAKPHYEDAFGSGYEKMGKVINNVKYYPLFRGTVDTPIKGDQVLVCTFGGENYYIGPVNTINSPNWNPDHLNNIDENLTGKIIKKVNSISRWGLSKNFKPLPITRLSKLYNDDLDGEQVSINDITGDTTFEGRYGNSIRLGSRDVNPCIIISNGRSPYNIMENISDSGLISFTEKGSITQHFSGYMDLEKEETVVGFTLASDMVKENQYLIGDGFYNYDYSKPQLFQSSDRITLNAKKDGLFLSSFGNTIIGTGESFIVKSKTDIMFDSDNIYLGKGYDDSSSYEMDKLVLGDKLNEVLEDLVKLLESATALVQGVPVPLTDTTGAPLLPKIQQLKTKLNSNEHLSNKCHIEKNSK
tara:strand:+ start:316 stop:1560 length:1245 start_codon:yes stop_codon:yes gene_type:complete